MSLTARLMMRTSALVTEFFVPLPVDFLDFQMQMMSDMLAATEPHTQTDNNAMYTSIADDIFQ